jgi:hypothetical protein
MPWFADDDSDYSTSPMEGTNPAQDQLNGISPLDPKKKKVPVGTPGTITIPPQTWGQPGAPASNVEALAGQMPTPPHPSILQRVLAGAVGFGAGMANTRAGRPGGVSQPINAQPAMNAIMGKNAYDQALANWTQKVKLAEYADTQTEKAREADERSQDRKIALMNAQNNQQQAQDYHNMIIDARLQNQQLVEGQKEEAEKAKFFMPAGAGGMGGQLSPLAETQEMGAYQLPTNDSSPPPAPEGLENLPIMGQSAAAMRSPAQTKVANPVTPGYAEMPTPPWTPKGFRAEVPTPATAAAQRGLTVTQQDIDLWKNIPNFDPNDVKIGDPITNPARTSMNNIARQALKPTTPKAPPQTADSLLGLRASGATTGIPEYDKYTPQQAAAALKLQHPGQQTQATPPSQLADAAEAIASYKQPMPPFRAYRGSAADYNELDRQVKALNPSYSAIRYNSFNKAELNATSGPMSNQANALNTMMGHLDMLDKAIGALQNNDIKALNGIANYFGVQTGNVPVAVFQTIVHRLGPEISKAYIQGGGTAGERGTNEEDFNPSLAPQILRGNVAMSARLAESKIKALQDQYKRGTYGMGEQQLITDEAEAIRQRLAASSGNIGGGMISVQIPGQLPGQIPAAQLDAFKKKYPNAQVLSK